MRKQKVKNKKVTIIVLIAISIFFLTISVGYSYLQQKMNIYGKATVVTDESGKYIKGNSTYKCEIRNTAENDGENYKIYDVKLTIVNMDSDISSWQVSFDVPQGYKDAPSEVAEKYSKKYADGRVTIDYKDGYIAKGNALELEMKLAINGEFDINNLTLNGRLATKVK